MTRSLSCALALAASLATTAAKADQKIAYVDLQRALLEVEEGKNAKARLKAEFDKRQKTLDVEQSALKKDKEDLDKRAMAMSDESRRQKEAELQGKLMEVTNHWQTSQKELSEQEQQLTGAIFQKMETVIADIAQAERVDFVFDKRAGLVYAPPSLDLTNELVRKYNDKYGAGSASAETKPTKKSRTSKADKSADAKPAEAADPGGGSGQ